MKRLWQLFKSIYLAPFWLCMGIGSGSNEGSSSGRPLTAEERSAIYKGAISDLGSSMPNYFNDRQFNGPQYTSPKYQNAGGPQMIDNGDINQLQSQMTTGYEAPLDYAKGKDMEKLNTDLSNRGIWSSGLANHATTDLNAAYAPQYAKAGADATNAAFGLQNSQLQAANQYNLNNAGQQNTFNMANAGQQYQSQWAPLNYLQGIWNGTGGAISSGSSGGMNWSI